MNYYNEHDPKAAAWLRELISAGEIPNGIVDERSICDVLPRQLAHFTQCHFFAGIGGWSLALHLAGWSEDEPVWTGSCPCQPFSTANGVAGGGLGFADYRHLWPAWDALIGQCRPAIIFGEQVTGAIKKGWWDLVSLSLEAKDYACGAAVLPACAFGADHERERLFWMAYASGTGWKRHQQGRRRLSSEQASPHSHYGDALIRARRALGGDLSDLLPCNGLSVQVARDAVKGYGNAIIPQAAAEFITAGRACISK